MKARDDEILDWLFGAAEWWVTSCGGYERVARAPVLLPTDEYFPVQAAGDEFDLALTLFDHAKLQAGLEDWPLELVVDEEGDPAEVMRGMPHAITSPPTPLDPDAEEDLTLQEGEPLTIPVGVRALSDATVLLATVARGMAHYVINAAAAPPPGDDEQRELYVDLGAVMLGFGVFCANASFRFQQFTEGMMVGWGYSRHGALSQRELSYALALHAIISGAKTRHVARYLESNPRADFKRARKVIEKKRRANLDALRAASDAAGPYRTRAH